jgi:hypothetical protein
MRKGKVRRAKLFYMRELRGKAARIREKRGMGSVAAAVPGAAAQESSET